MYIICAMNRSDNILANILFLFLFCLLLSKARLHAGQGGSQGQYKSKYTINRSDDILANILFLFLFCLLLGKARLHAGQGGGQGQYKSKYTINGVNDVDEPATEAVYRKYQTVQGQAPHPLRYGYSPNFWVGVCCTVLKTLTLFQSKIYDFSDPISDLTPKI